MRCVGSIRAGFSKCKNASVAVLNFYKGPDTSAFAMPFFKCYFSWTIRALIRHVDYFRGRRNPAVSGAPRVGWVFLESLYRGQEAALRLRHGLYSRSDGNIHRRILRKDDISSARDKMGIDGHARAICSEAHS